MNVSQLRSRNGLRWVIGAHASRSIAYGFLSVVLGVYLVRSGVPPVVAGALFSIALAGDSLITIALARYGERLGRRRSLALLGVGMTLTGFLFALTNHPFVLILVAFFGTVSATSSDSAPFLSIEQALIPELAPENERTRAFATYDTAGSVAGALGTALGAIPGVLAAAAISDELTAARLMLFGYGVLALPSIVAAFRLDPSVELRADSQKLPPLHESKGAVFTLAGLFALDSFASGFIIQSLIVYWFALQFGAGTAILGPALFAANLLSALSYQLAVPLAKRIGLVQTMVYTHLPSAALMMVIPFAPTLEIAIGLLLARSFLSRMDTAPRQAFIAAIVTPSERIAAAAITNIARSSAQATAPVFSGMTMGSAFPGAPFLIGGGLKIIYDLAILALFRKKSSEIRSKAT